MPDLVAPLVIALPLHLLDYHTTVALGANVDQPFNRAKAVTVK